MTRDVPGSWTPAHLERALREQHEAVARINHSRIGRATSLDLPLLEELQLHPIVENLARSGCIAEPAVSYLLRSNEGVILFDVGCGATTKAFDHNLAATGQSLDVLEGITLSHLHPDHAGGASAEADRTVALPSSLPANRDFVGYSPVSVSAPIGTWRVVEEASPVGGGLWSTGPLAFLHLFGPHQEEQALLARTRRSGPVLVVGCGHPGLATMLSLACRLAGDAIRVVCGGLHLGDAHARDFRSRLQDARTAMTEAGVERLLISTHDSDECIFTMLGSANSLTNSLTVEILRAGDVYSL